LCYGPNCEQVRCIYRQKSEDVESFLQQNQNSLTHRDSIDKIKSKEFFCITYITSASIKREDFDKMLDCTEIDLNGNSIESLERAFFIDLYQLISLDLSNNVLTSLPKNIFDDLTNLETLLIRNNLLQHLIDDDIFKYNEYLSEIDLSNNQIYQISPHIFKNLNHLKLVKFHGNLCINFDFSVPHLQDLNEKIVSQCSDRNIITFLTLLMKLSSELRRHEKNESHAKRQHILPNSSVATTTESQTNLTSTSTITPTIFSSSVFPTASNLSENKTMKSDISKYDIILERLFWFMIPVILLLFAILAMILFAIYKKYFKYSINYPRRSL
jgi:hypothetical protein